MSSLSLVLMLKEIFFHTILTVKNVLVKRNMLQIPRTNIVVLVLSNMMMLLELISHTIQVIIYLIKLLHLNQNLNLI